VTNGLFSRTKGLFTEHSLLSIVYLAQWHSLSEGPIKLEASKGLNPAASRLIPLLRFHRRSRARNANLHHSFTWR
jgi:hypothetical protein